jgi:DNA-3-methyladenine glycosylase II
MSQPTLDLTAALKHLRRVEGPMAALIGRHGRPDFRRTRDSFASLGRAIIYQQLSGKAAETIYRRFLALYSPARFPRPAQLLATTQERLRSVGVSRAKASYLLDLAQKYADGTIEPRRFTQLDNQALGAMLTQVKGIGPWSVDMFLMFDLQRPDILPVGDLGVRKGMQRYFALSDLPAPKQMTELAAPWQPFRSVAAWYMWRVAENGLPENKDGGGR